MHDSIYCRIKYNMTESCWLSNTQQFSGSAFTMSITSGSNRKAFFPWEQSGSGARPREVVPRFPGSMGLSPELLGLTAQLTLVWAVSQTRHLLSPCCPKLSHDATVLHDSMILWRPVCLIISKKNPSHIKYIRLVCLLVSSQQHQNAVPMKSRLQRLMYFCLTCLSLNKQEPDMRHRFHKYLYVTPPLTVWDY